MTLRRMKRQVQRARDQDESLRVVYPAGHVKSEGSSDPTISILGFMTREGFGVSLGLA
ncbi:hypothetical protein ACFPL7_04320 [Dongia soli]|uniref:Uncharacterized protein n=1 Tax=Dongia soli TaxID=600628 RepID=A0ABU5EHU1_9PROT|nr:hypothetical protein [Dongia soli]MDY0885776.1 hypothetical protein [Dongia soli]